MDDAKANPYWGSDGGVCNEDITILIDGAWKRNVTQAHKQLHKDYVAGYKELHHGMHSDAFTNEIGLRSFMQKAIYCFIWCFRSIRITFTPTVQHCSMATVIGLCLRVKLKHYFPPHYKVDIEVSPGSYADEGSVSGVLNSLMKNLNPSDNRQILRLGHGDPSHFPCFYTSPFAEDAVVDALRSRQFNCYSSTAGILPARKAVAEYLSRHLPNKLSPDDIFLTLGCTHAIEVALSVLSNPGANILIPKPGFPYYEAVSANTDLEIRHFNLLPEKGWEVDLDAVGALADENTVAMVIINPGNPCGNVYSYEHLQKVAETAKKLGILVIADEVYEHLTFGKNSFIPMGVFSNIVPVLTLGSISKRWIVPGWRVGWLVTNDFHGVLQKSGLVDSIKDFLNISSDPVTFIQ
uniref:Aminotransferase class I/classII large domain-containing protein n=1 Tax=Chenopodium quinoa TaxID=63459 RepID=A0A803MVW6_CHEQI